ncbi:hypothetical protein Tco_1444667 [Tanacetum coccineum]
MRKFILQGPYTLSTITILEKEAIHLLLTGIGDEIYSTVDACKTAHEMWIAIERLQQGESLNRMSRLVCFGSLENLPQEMENKLSHTTPEWSRFVTVVKQTIDLDKESYHKLYDILEQYQKEVYEIRAEKIARNANPLALVPAAQQYLDTYYHAPKSHKSYAPPLKYSSSTRSHASTKYKGKEIAKPITPPSESAFEEDNTSPRYKNNNQTRQFGNQRRVIVAGTRETVGSQVVQAKDYTYHKDKMLLCKQAKKGVPLQAEQANWLEDTDEKVDEQELEAHYMYMANVYSNDDYNVFVNERQYFVQYVSINNTCVVEKVDSNVIPDSSDMCDNDNQTDQNGKEYDDKRVVLANLIANLKLDTDENKKIQKQLKKANTSLSHELRECKSAFEECKSSLGESNRT